MVLHYILFVHHITVNGHVYSRAVRRGRHSTVGTVNQHGGAEDVISVVDITMKPVSPEDGRTVEH